MPSSVFLLHGNTLPGVVVGNRPEFGYCGCILQCPDDALSAAVLRVLSLMVLVCLAPSKAALARSDMETQYEVTGVWSGEMFRVTAVEIEEAGGNPEVFEVSGRITALDPKKKIMTIGPVTVQWSDSTVFEDLSPEALQVATSVEAEGRTLAPGRMLAALLKPAPALPQVDSVQLVGTASDPEEFSDGSARINVMGVPAYLPPAIYDSLRSAPAADEDADDPIPPRPGVRLGGEYEAILDYQNGFALDRREKDDLFRLDQELQLRLAYRHNPWVSLFVEAKVLGETELFAEGRGRKSNEFFERGEMWVRIDRLLGQDLRLQIGRQNFEEPRRWWWDDDLDAVRMRYRRNSWSFEVGIAREFFPSSTEESFIDPEEDEVLRILARANWRYSKYHSLDLFFLHQNDRSPTPSPGILLNANREDESDATLWWLGLRAMGRKPLTRYGEFSYWGDAAMVLGQEKFLEFEDEPGDRLRVVSRNHRRVSGWALDFGGRWATMFPTRPMLTLGYALGSGDRHPERGADRSFRQTGLQSTDEQFRTYGELLRPELSNLRVATLAVEFPIISESRLEFAYRHFRQQHAVPFLRDARIETEPNGQNKTIGQEWMVMLGLKEWQDLEIELVGAAFRAGPAYGRRSGNMAYSLFTKFTFEF